MPINLQCLQVLVVDDNTHMRNLVRAILNALDIGGLRECIDGSDALEVLRTFPADLAIVDWMMEPLDGIDFLRLLRRPPDSPARYVGVIMMSGHSQADNVAQARDAGANEFVVKPISARTLYQRIV